jgi:hypothetical protein
MPPAPTIATAIAAPTVASAIEESASAPRNAFTTLDDPSTPVSRLPPTMMLLTQLSLKLQVAPR